MADVFSAFMKDSEKESLLQKEIVDNLFSQTNLEQKTELDKPLKWSVLTLIKNFLTSKNLPKSAELLDTFTIISMRYLLSKNRKSRSEYIAALNALNDITKSGENSDKPA